MENLMLFECFYNIGEAKIILDNNLQICYPEIAAEWDFELNDKRPEEYAPYSNKPAHWICPAGHRYVSKINNRVRAKGNGCKYCNGQKALKNYNDLKFLYPEVALDWHPTKNEDLHADMVTARSNRSIWWQCHKCHQDWKARVSHRTLDDEGCPFCNGHRTNVGKTDLLTLYPGIEKMWDIERNGERCPQDFTKGSHFKAVWICQKGHSYHTPIYIVTRAWDTCLERGETDRLLSSGCPVCNYSKRVDSGENDLESQAPWLMKEWDFQRNTVDPSKIPVHSNISVYWKCEKDHSWRATPNNRKRTGCPVCNANHLSRGENSLDVVDPVLAAQWSMKNFPKTPREVTAYCNDKYIWECSEGHEWTATVANRHLGEGCPYCTHRKADTGKNDLKTKFPLIASQFQPELNNGKKPENYLPFSNELIVWECCEKHHWKAPIYCRTLLSSECPKCKGLRRSVRKTI